MKIIACGTATPEPRLSKAAVPKVFPGVEVRHDPVEPSEGHPRAVAIFESAPEALEVVPVARSGLFGNVVLQEHLDTVVEQVGGDPTLLKERKPTSEVVLHPECEEPVRVVLPLDLR